MWNPFAIERREVLVSPLARESCEERLRAQTGSIWNPFTWMSHPVRGSVNARGFWIVKALRYRNSAQTEARGVWHADGSGTRIEIEFGMRQRWLMAIVTGLFVVFCILWWLSPVTSRTSRLPLAIATSMPLIMLAIFVFAVAFGRWLARNESEFLLEFLRRTLDCPPGSEPLS